MQNIGIYTVFALCYQFILKIDCVLTYLGLYPCNFILQSVQQI